eukprot:Gb_08619 [translate_table: standard]
MRFCVRLFHHSGNTITIANNTLKPRTQITILKTQAQTSDIATLCREGRLKDAMSILLELDQHCIPMDSDIYAPLLQACANFNALEEGKQLHAHMLATGIEQNVYIETKLVNMYAMCGSFVDARLVFDKIKIRNIFAWNGMIRGYVIHGHYKEALTLYDQMQKAGMQADNYTFPFVLKACADLADLQQGKDIHDYIIRSGLESDVYVSNALVAMYGKCGNIDDARQVFDRMPGRDLVSWTTLLSGYAQNGQANEALKLFRQMWLAGVKPNSVTTASVLPACGNLVTLQQGKEIHGYIIKSGFESDIFVASALVDMYAKCGSIEFARLVFDKMSQRNVVSWNGMISGYIQNGHANEALRLFHQMQLSGLKPNWVTIASILPACARLTALHQGNEIHDYIIRNGFGSVILVGNALIDMYAKCGSIEFACHVFDRMSERDAVSWTAMIAAYGMHGHGDDALRIFYQMQHAGLKPDPITFVGVLSACSHAGLLDEGLHYFEIMSRDYCITPRVEHYACIVDLLGRAGRLLEAREIIKKMPFDPGAVVWGGLLSACRIHHNVELGEHVAELLFELEPENPGNYALLSNIYAEAGRWDDVAKVRRMMKNRGLKKRPGCSWIKVKNRVHAFHVGDTSHPQWEKIYALLESLAQQVKEAGYVPDTRFVLHDVEDEEKEYILCGHSEKLAIAFGLINTCPGTPILITKNLRVCGDCHGATKFISKVVEREIIVRDANRFHHFKDGLCSCGDYW